MPRYRIVVEGRGLETPTLNGLPVRGFFVRRVIRAASVGAAKAEALARVERDWQAGKFAKLGMMPELEAVEAEPVGVLGWLTTRTDYVFHRGQ